MRARLGPSVTSSFLLAAVALLAGAPPALATTTPLFPLFLGVEGAGSESRTQTLPFLGEEARKRGIELPAPFGVGVVYYHLDRAIDITDVRVGRNGESPSSVSQFAQLGSSSRVDNLNVKFDVWLLPFLNVYAIAGYIWNESSTTIDVTLPPLAPGGAPRQRRMTVPTELTGTVGGLGLTLAGGYGPFFVALDVNAAQADLGFDNRFHAVVTSARGGWHGQAGDRPVRAWVNATYWNTFAEATGTVADPDGGTLAFEVDQGPEHPWTFGLGMAYSATHAFDLAVDGGSDFHGGWYVALVPVFRF
jgi:hypothetical protein